jgi:hypothetical protein
VLSVDFSNPNNHDFHTSFELSDFDGTSFTAPELAMLLRTMAVEQRQRHRVREFMPHNYLLISATILLTQLMPIYCRGNGSAGGVTMKI